jgi:hypothetical protein
MNHYGLNEQDHAEAQQDEIGGMAVIAWLLVWACWAVALTLAMVSA